MTKLQELSAELHVSLEEWRDAGGPTENIVKAIIRLVEDSHMTEHAEDCNVRSNSTKGSLQCDCGFARKPQGEPQ